VTNRLVYAYGFREGEVTYFDAFPTTEKALEAAGLRE
jgi:CRISPR/Cas system CMR subunit Cmr6 (Cas7 group RAMP superfamily)